MSKDQETKYHKGMVKERRKQQLRKVNKNKLQKRSKGKTRRENRLSFDDAWGDMASENVERVMPRGSASRQKAAAQTAFTTTVLEQSGEDEHHLSQVEGKGVVVEVSGGQCVVQVEGRQIPCTLRGTLSLQNTGYVNLVAVGDRVLVSLDGCRSGVVEKVLPRRSVLARPYSPDAGKTIPLQQLIAANVELLLVVASWRQPDFWPELVDRYLITAQRNRIKPVICINKIDLAVDQDELAQVEQIYRDLGFTVILTSAVKNQGLVKLKEALSGHITVLTGLSGAGKSSLLSAMQPGLDLRAFAVGHSGRSKGQGRHTTTAAKMYPLEGGGSVIDTPGIREFSLSDLRPVELAENYPEMVAQRIRCRYADCLHRDEPGCAVQQGVESGQVSRLRYESYLKIMADLID
jgi:ribosome biogenesis GTPase